MKKLSVIIILLLALTTDGLAQSSASASASAVIVNPIGITAGTSSSSDGIRWNGNPGLRTTDTRRRTSNSSKFHHAFLVSAFTISGEPYYTYSISLITPNLMVGDRGNVVGLDFMIRNAGSSSGIQKMELGAVLRGGGNSDHERCASFGEVGVMVNYD